jgi:hypothetical protein
MSSCRRCMVSMNFLGTSITSTPRRSRKTFKAKFGPRGVLKCKATEVDDPTEDPRFGRVGKQTIEDAGPLTKKRMETIDDETTRRRRRLHSESGESEETLFLR